MMSPHETSLFWANDKRPPAALKGLLCTLCVLCVLALTQFGAAAEEGYTGVLDSFTGEPGTVYGTGADGGKRVQLTNTVSYDRSRCVFCYTLPSMPAEVTANIMDGAITTAPVSISVPENVVVELYCDGKPSDQDLLSIRERGSYALNYIEGLTVSQVLTFRIIGNVSGEIDHYRMPTGFRVTEVTRDGERVYTNKEEADLTEEGDYVISYAAPSIGVSNELRVRVDHTPPSITLKGVEDGMARGPVQIVDLEEGAAVQVLLNGTVLPNTLELTQSGEYFIAVMDEAGNTSTVQFTIMVYFNSNSLAFFLMLLAGGGACVVYAVTARKRLRVR